MSGHRSLAFRLYGQLRARPGNVLVSPASLWSALALVHPGAGGTAQDQLAALLGIADLEPVAALDRTLRARHEVESGFVLRVASKLWVQTGYALEPAYVDALTASLDAAPASADFAHARADACAAINRWVERATGGGVRELAALAGLPPAARAVLVDAASFQARWAAPFSPERTEQARFHRLDGSAVHVPTMRGTKRCGYTADADVAVIELPFANPDVVMDLVVPTAGAFDTVERALSLAYFFTLVGELEPGTAIELALPRFAVASQLALSEPLLALGLRDVFGTGGDFTALSAEPGFHLDEVLHESRVAIDEHGSGAAPAADAGAAGVPAPRAPASARAPVVVRVDRPFFFAVRDVPSNSILFFGRVRDPSL